MIRALSNSAFKRLPGSQTEKVYLNCTESCYFTRREAQCVYHLVNLKYRWRVAERLGLSRRTVDAYIETAKRKIATPTQKLLIQYALRNNFLEKMRSNHKALI